MIPSFPRFRCKPGFFGRSISCSLSQHSQCFHFFTMLYHTMDKHSCLVQPYTLSSIFYIGIVFYYSKILSFFYHLFRDVHHIIFWTFTNLKNGCCFPCPFSIFLYSPVQFSLRHVYICVYTIIRRLSLPCCYSTHS